MSKLDVFSAGTVAVISANQGGFDRPVEHQPQSIPADFFEYNEPQRLSMTPRMQAKIPKMFGWQLYPGYDYYVYLDGNLRLKDHNSLDYLIQLCEDVDIVVLQHPDRNTVWWEYRYNWRGLNNNAPSNYLTKRYKNEWLDEQLQALGTFKDDLLVNGGVFIYKDTPAIRQMFKEWWYHVTRYLIMDQLAFPHVLKTVNYKVIPDVFRDCWWLENVRHAK